MVVGRDPIIIVSENNYCSFLIQKYQKYSDFQAFDSICAHEQIFTLSPRLLCDIQFMYIKCYCRADLLRRRHIVTPGFNVESLNAIASTLRWRHIMWYEQQPLRDMKCAELACVDCELLFFLISQSICYKFKRFCEALSLQKNALSSRLFLKMQTYRIIPCRPISGQRKEKNILRLFS